MDTSNAYGMNQDSEMTQTQPAYCASSVKPSREPEASVWGVLIPKNGINIEQQFDLSKTIYTIGRHKGCDITIPDARISKIHCTISSEYSLGRLKVYIEDSSANGTQVNHLTPLQTGQRMELNSGDEIYLCSTRSVASFIFINMSERFVNNRTTLRATFSEIFPKTSIRRVEDDYILGHEIGNGQCGHVHLCVHRFSKEKYACKIIDTSKFGIRPGLTSAELRQEAEILRSLDHPNIIKIIDSYEAEGILYIVMELMQGGDLFDRVNERRKYSEDASRKVTLNILSAVQYLHERKIIHRDLKPENILMVSRTDDTDIKITDFGLAKKANQEGLKTFCGTPQYFAPEVLKRRNTVRGAGRYGAAADMWSIGVILYILLSGTFPFSEENLDKELELGAYNFRSAAWSGVSASARHLVSRLMEIRPEKRMTADIALQHPWIKNESFAERGEAEEMGGNVADLIPRPLLSQLSWRRSWPRELDVNGERKPLGKEMTVSEDILARLGKMEIQSVHRSATESKREIALAKELPEDKIQEFEDSPGASFFGTKKRSRGKEAESSTKKKREVYLNNIRDSMALSTTLLNDVGIGEVENLNNIKVVAVVVSKTATSSSNMSKKKKGKDSSTSTSISTTQKKLTDLFKPSKK